MLEQPWISLDISVEDGWFKMKLLNGKVNEPSTIGKGIGLSNVVRRLELLYAGRHQLLINDEGEVFIVKLKIQLEKDATLLTTSNSFLTAREYA